MSTLQTLAQALEKKKAELVKLEAELLEAREKELTALPAQVGLESVDELIKALAAFASPRMKGLLGGKAASPRAARVGASTATGEPAVRKSAKTAPDGTSSRRTRTKITDEIKAQVKKLSEEGKTGLEIAAAAGVSLPSVANIKRELGLTKPRAK